MPQPGRWMTVMFVVLGVVVVSATATTFAQSAARWNKSQLSATPGEIELVPVRGHIYMIGGAGANVAISAGLDGVFVVDTGLPQHAAKLLDTIRQLQQQLQLGAQPAPRWGAETHASTNLEPFYRLAPPKPIRYIANTSWLPDHVGGNEALAKAGKTFTGGNVAGELGDVGEGAAILAHENTLTRMNDEHASSRALPTDTYFGNVMKLSYFFNGEGIELLHMPSSTTDGTSVIHFRGTDVLCTGEILDMTRFPYFDLSKGGSIQGTLDALNRLVDLSVAEFRSEGGTLIVPGHGRVIDIADLTYYRDMTTIIRDRIQDGIKRSLTIAQIKAAKPTEDWDPRFGTEPTWTPDMFVEAVYKSLMNPPKAR